MPTSISRRKVLPMQSNEIRKRFLEFFKARGHAILPSAPLITADEPGVTNATLFNTAGVQPIIPAILAGEHAEGSRLASAQKCVRTTDLEEVGDNTHLTFFEMLGNWSIGDYFKQDAITWSWELLTSQEEGLGLDPKRLYVTVFEGDDNAPRDEASYEIWKGIFESAGLDPAKRIFFLPASENWWAAGDNGPCGPDTEMFYDVTNTHLDGLSGSEEFMALSDDKQDLVEIWNDVFMEFEKKDGQVIGKLPSQNVDTGSGLERLTMVLQGASNVYETDMFSDAMEMLSSLPKLSDRRIVADHLRSLLMLVTEKVTPGKTGREYVVRRLARRVLTILQQNPDANINYADVVNKFNDQYQGVYDLDPELVIEALQKEEQKFTDLLAGGLKEIEKGNTDPFVLFTTYGLPVEVIRDLFTERGLPFDEEALEKQMKAHQDLSRAGAEQKFKGGLADHSEETVKLHTAHHLLLAALQEVVDPEIKQRGSNITGERMRMDFSFDRKLTDEEKSAVEDLVNQKIQAGLNVVCREMPLEEAKEIGAQMEFGAKYPDTVSVYFIEGEDGEVFSKEFCGGPHVTSTNQLGTFKIKKEKASAAGVRRIKAILE